MARESWPNARRGESTMEVLLDDVEEGAASRSMPESPEERAQHQAVRAAATLPPPPAFEADAGDGGSTTASDGGSTTSGDDGDTTSGSAAPASVPPVGAPAAPASGGEEGLKAQARQLIEACEAELTTNPELRRAGRLHYEIARMYESVLGDMRHAAAHYQEALRYAPEHVATIRGARRALLARRNPRAAVTLFDAEARLSADPHRKAALYLAKGRLLDDVLGRKAEAREAYVTAFELDRGHPAILKALEQSYLDTADWEEVDRVLERAANAVSDDPRHRAALIVQRAEVLEARRGDLDGAIELYETALRLDPTVSGAVEALKRLHHQQRRFRDLIRVLEVESQHAADPHVRAMALYRIGRIHLERLGSRDEALTAFERAARQAPGDLLVLEELVPLYEAAGRPDRVVETLQALVDASPLAEEKASLLHRMGHVHEIGLGDPQSAIDCYEAALRLSPDHVPTLQALGRVYAELDRAEDLVRLHAHEAEHASESHRRAAAHVRAAEVLEHRLGRKVDATDHHARALKVVPGHPAAFKSLVRLLSEAHKWRELIELYERAVELARRPGEAATHLFKIGALYEDALGEPAQAAHVYRRILEVDPEDMRAIHALQRTTERAGRWRDYLGALERESDKLEDDDKVPLLHRMAEVLHDQLGDWSGAVTRLREGLDIDGQHRPTLSTLGRLYHAAGRWEDLLEIFERELALTEDDPKRIELLGRMAELCTERIGRDAAAIDYYKRILELDPRHGQALRAIARLLQEKHDYDSLLQVLQMQFEALDEPKTRARIAFKMAEVYEQFLDDPTRAMRSYEKALEGMPGHRPSLDALVRLRASQSSWKALVEGLVQDATESADPLMAVDALVQAGDVCTNRLGDPKRALECYEQARDRAPGNVGVLLALERLYRRVGDHARLADVYMAEAETFADAGGRLAALRELLRLRIQHGLGDAADLRSTCDAILAIAPDDAMALEALEEEALTAGDRSQLVYVDSRLVSSLEDAGERAAHHTRIGESLEAQGDEAALEAYRAALAEDPENIAATRGLSRIAAQMDDPVALAEAARREARVSQDGETAAGLLVQSARTRADRLGDPSGAISDLVSALELAPGHAEAAERLDELMMQIGRTDRLTDLLARAAASASAPPRRTALWKRVAELQSAYLGNVTAAIGSLNRVLRSAPDDLETIRRLADLYRQDGQWNESVNLYHRMLQLAPDSEALREAHLHLAWLYDERMGETERALVSLQAVLALDPTHTGGLRRLAELHKREGRLEPARDASLRLVNASEETPERATALTLLASIERRAGRFDAARQALHDAIILEGPGGEAALEYRAEASLAEHWEAYVDAVWKHVRRSSEPNADCYIDIARVLADHLSRVDEALETLELGLQETGGDPALRRELATRLLAAGRHERAVEQLQRLIEREPTSVNAWRELSRVYDVAGQPSEARIAAEPLAILGVASTRDRQLLADHPPRPGGAAARALDAMALRRLTRFGPADQTAADLLTLLAPALCKLYPTDLDAFGLTIRDRIGSRSGHPLQELIERLAGCLGGPEPELYVHRVRGRGVSVELGDPPALLVPAHLLDAPLAQRVFLVARPLVAMAQGFHVVDKLTPRELEVALASAVRSVRPGFGRGLTSEELLDSQAKRIHRALARRARKALPAVAFAYVEGPKVDFSAWSSAVKRTSNRVAALFADDLMGVLDALAATERELHGLEPPALVEASPIAHDLLRFWGSDEAMALRSQLGLLP